MTGPNATPRVQARAEQLSVDLSKVEGTGAGGRIRLADVQAAATGPAAAPAARLAAIDREMQALRQPLAAAGGGARGPLFARNPLVDDARQAEPQRAARATGAAPTLFQSGDLPPFTASGIDPQTLLNVPWQARHAVAAAPTAAEALRLVELLAGDPDYAALEYGSSGENAAYSERVRAWLATGYSEDDLYTTIFGSQ